MKKLLLILFVAVGPDLGSPTAAQIVEPPKWAGKDGRVEEIDQFHFDDAAGVAPRLDGRAAFFGQRYLGVCSIAKIQKELELTNQQKKRVKDIYVDSVGLALDANRQLGKSMMQIMNDLQKKGPVTQNVFDEAIKGEKEKCRVAYREIDSAANELLANVLSAKQITRLRELVAQADTHQLGLGKTVENRKSELGMDDDAIEKLKVESNKKESEFKDKIRSLRAGKKEKILRILTPEQRRKLKELQGIPGQFGREKMKKN